VNFEQSSIAEAAPIFHHDKNTPFCSSRVLDTSRLHLHNLMVLDDEPSIAMLRRGNVRLCDLDLWPLTVWTQNQNSSSSSTTACTDIVNLMKIPRAVYKTSR